MGFFLGLALPAVTSKTVCAYFTVHGPDDAKENEQMSLQRTYCNPGIFLEGDLKTSIKRLKSPYSLTQQVHIQKFTSKYMSKSNYRDWGVGTFIFAFPKTENLEIV